ncbi:MAG: response regulator [Gammaproteobacteria bacterium]|nr:response regulator [Gammaproteobacteria bacterium]MDH5514196.1 response regulator [Gammaproteobacteria bacterium]
MARTAEQANILLIDDDPVVRLVLGEGIKADRFRITALPDGQCTLAACDEQTFDLAIIDQELPDTSGLELAKRLKKDYGIPFVFLTSSDDYATISAAAELGALGYMIKPVTPIQMAAEIDATLSRSKEINNLGKAIEVSGIVSVALGLVMQSQHLSRVDALNRLRKICRPQNLALRTLSEQLVEAFEAYTVSADVADLDPVHAELLGLNSKQYHALGKRFN